MAKTLGRMNIFDRQRKVDSLEQTAKEKGRCLKGKALKQRQAPSVKAGVLLHDEPLLSRVFHIQTAEWNKRGMCEAAI